MRVLVRGLLGDGKFLRLRAELGFAASGHACPWVKFSASSAQVEPRITRNRKEQVQRSAPAPLLLDTSPKRKRRHGSRAAGRSRRHATDLEDLDVASSRGSATDNVQRSGEAADNPVPNPRSLIPEHKVRTLIHRPVASLPRTPSHFVKFGAPMTAENLTHDAPSIFVESRKVIDDVLERRQTMQAAPDYVAPDTPFWRTPRTVLRKTGVKWKGPTDFAGNETELAPVDEQSNISTEVAAEVSREKKATAARNQLRGIKDLSDSRKGWRAESVAPARLAGEVLDTTKVGVESDPCLPNESKKPQRNSQVRPNQRRRSNPADSLVASLRQRAQDFDKTGVDPDIKQSLVEALASHPGAERAARLQEMQSCTMDFAELVESGKASVPNFNELIRAQGLQGNMEAALQTYNAMHSHGYDPDQGTYVSLIMGAGVARDAEFARKIFLEMRGQMVSANLKVYAALIKAHVQAGDVDSGFALMHKMEDEGLKSDVVIYTILIDGLVKANKLERAWEEFHSIRTWKLIEPDEVLFTVMIKACALASEPERALNIYDDMRMCGLYPTDITYGELIHAMSKTNDFAHRAWDFYRHMQAEDLPITPFVYSKLLHASRTLGDPRRAQTVVEEMQAHGEVVTSEMFYDLVGVFTSALKYQNLTQQEVYRNLRCTWHIVGEAKKNQDDIDWTKMLNEVMSVYVAGKFTQYAVDLLQQYPAFDVSPDGQTYLILLEMLGRDVKDVGRFFALWESLPRSPKPDERLYHLALEMAMESRSSKTTIAVLEEMYEAEVFPTPDLTDKLAKVARHVLQVHELVGKLISLNKSVRVTEAKRETELLQTHIDERELILATQGLTSRSPTPAQEVRAKHFESLHKRGFFRRPWLPIGEYKASKDKGGEVYAARHDKPRPNILASR